MVRQDSFEELAKIILDFGFWILENCPIPHFKIDRVLGSLGKCHEDNRAILGENVSVNVGEGNQNKFEKILIIGTYKGFLSLSCY